MSRDELLVVVDRQAGQLAEQAAQLAARDRQIARMAGQLSEVMEANEALAAKLARLEHLLSRNSGNSSSPPSRDDGPGKPPPPEKPRRGRSGPARTRDKQPGVPGSHLAWTDDPHERRGCSRPVVATAARIWQTPRIWGWSTASSSTRSRRSRCGSPSTTSTRWPVAGAGADTPPPGRRVPGPARSATGRTWPRSRSTSWWCTSCPRIGWSRCWDRALGRVRARAARPHRRAVGPGA